MKGPASTNQELLDEIITLKNKIRELEKNTETPEQSKEIRMEDSDLFHSLVEATNDCIWEINSDGIYTYVSPKIKTVLGYSSEDIIGKRPFDFMPKEEAERVGILFKEISDSHRPFTGLENTNTHKDGRGIILETSGVPVVDARGKFLGYRGYARDITERKKTEEALRTNQLRLTEAMDLEHIAYWEFDPAEQTYVFDDAFYALYGTTAEQEGGYRMTMGDYAKRFVHPEDQPFFYHVVKENDARLDPEFMGDVEHRIVRRDGNVRYMRVRTKAIKDLAGRLIRLYGANQDITEFRRAQEALRESEEKYRNIFENAVEGIFQTSRRWHPISINPAVARILGYGSPQEAIADVTDLARQLYVNPDDRKKLEEELDARGIVEGFETQMYRKEGDTIWLSLNVRTVMDTSGEVICYEGTAIDITKRKQVEEELRRSHAMYRTIFDNSGTSMIIIGEDTIITLCNEEWTKLSGYSREEIENKMSWTEFIHKDDLREMQEYHRERRIDPSYAPRQYEFRFINRNGDVYNMINTVAMIPGTKMSLAAQLDITSLKQAETEKAQLQARLLQSQKMEAIGTLAGGIAHDFNNILTALMGYASLVQAKMNTSDLLRPYVDQILTASEKAAELIQGLLAFSRQQSITLVPIGMNATIRDSEKLLRRLLTENIDLHISLTEKDTVVIADKSQMDQIFFNLVTNARDAMPQGGIITIETAVSVIDTSFIKKHGFGKEGDYVRISISDTGKGMDEITQQKIFDPFFTTKEIGKGTGLGLATVYGIVKQHNGYITVESTLDQGTTFHVYFPKATMEVDKKKVITTPVIRGKETILIAEDNESARRFMQEVLNENGYKIIEAIDGEDAVNRFKQHRTVDLIILDSVMPKKNGREVYEEIYKMDPRIKVLFTSGYTKDFVLDKGIEDKEFNFIAKPLSLDGFLRKVREVLDK